MAEKNEKLGMLLLFDAIAVILSTFGVLMLFQLLQHESDMNLLIVSCFFVGIKILVLGIVDITGVARRAWIGLIFIIVADIIVFAVNIFMAFSISMRFLLITTIADIIIVFLAHLLWQKVFGSAYEEARERSDWLSGDINEDVEEHEENAMYTAILDTLEEKDGYTDEINTQEVEAAVEDDAHDDDEDTYLDEEAFKSLLISDDALDEAAEEIAEEEAEAAADEAKPETVTESEPEEPEVAADEAEAAAETEPEEDVEQPEATPAETEAADEAVAEPAPSLDAMLGDDTVPQDSEQITALEKRLSDLLSEINTSTKGTERLERSVSEFKEELNNLLPVTTDKDILTTGDVIRTKLKNIIDKQFIVDEVLSDLTRLSEQINKRIDDLDAIEADLNRRKEALDKKELMYMHRKPRDFEDVEVQILPDEVMLESDDAEIIIDAQDLEAVKRYLKENPDQGL